MAAQANILVVDDQPNMRQTVVRMLEGAGHRVAQAGSVTEALEQVSRTAFDLLLTDLRMEGEQDGLSVLRDVRAQQPTTEVIVMTAYGSVETAVDAIRAGAFDYVLKPFRGEELLARVDKALERSRMAAQLRAVSQDLQARYGLTQLLGRSPAIRDLLARIVRVAPTDAAVLITGEAGTGKERLARSIHAASQRANKPFVVANCADIPESLLESELFGVGASAGALPRAGLFCDANGGTLYLEELGALPSRLQPKVLAAIKGELPCHGDGPPRKADMRIIASTSEDLPLSVSEKRFHADLFYWLNDTRFDLPPLRNRREDIPLLAEEFLRAACREHGVEAHFVEGAIEAISAYRFPGNVRELESIVRHALSVVGKGPVRASDLLPDSVLSAINARRSEYSLELAVDEAEREAIIGALRACGGSREMAAQRLEISVTTLWRKMTRLNVVFPSTRPPEASA